MLITKMEIEFYKLNYDFDGYSAKDVLRPPFNFGEGLLFSGTIKSDGIVDTYLFGKVYTVVVEFPTIEDEAYEAIKHLLNATMNLSIQSGSKVIGSAKLLNFTFVP